MQDSDATVASVVATIHTADITEVAKFRAAVHAYHLRLKLYPLLLFLTQIWRIVHRFWEWVCRTLLLLVTFTTPVPI